MDYASFLDSESKSKVPKLDSKLSLDSVFSLDSAFGLPEILGLCVRFACFWRRGEGATLSVVTDAEPNKSSKDCVQAEFLGLLQSLLRSQ